jgi:hypothetical protein
VLERLPEAVRHEFPAKCFPKTALDNSFLGLIERQVVNGQSFSDLQKMYREVNHGVYWKKVLQ